MEYPWYSVIHGENGLLQGDFVLGCPIVVPPSDMSESEPISIEVLEINSIVLSQSCDLANDHITIALVCPYYSLADFFARLPSEMSATVNAKRKKVEELKKGNLPGYHLLNKLEGHMDDYQVVDFRNVYGIHIACLKAVVQNQKERIRLLPPYREHLSQAFARYFMRVGLPQEFKVDPF